MHETISLEMEPPVYEDQFWDPDQETGFWEAEPAEQQFARGAGWDVQSADPVLAMSVIRTAESDVSGLSDNELLGAIAAGERVLGQAAWAANRLAAEYTRRNLEIDDKTGEETLGEFGADDYAQEVKLSGMAAKGNLNRSLTLSQLPMCMKLAHDGALDPALLAKADDLIAKDATGRLRDRSAAIHARSCSCWTRSRRRRRGRTARRTGEWSSDRNHRATSRWRPGRCRWRSPRRSSKASPDGRRSRARPGSRDRWTTSGTTRRRRC
jgi:hypothetical protein